MRLVDTSAWIEWLVSSPVGQSLKAEIPARADWLVPTIVQLELAKWLYREAGEEKADRVIAYTRMCRVVELDTKIALATAAIAVRHKLSTADAIIYATALEHGADILTCDAHFKGLRYVKFIAKTGG